MSILDRFRLDGKVAVVTGAAQGLGAATVQAFVEAGATVVGFDRVAGQTIAGVTIRPLDVSDISNIEAAFDGIAEEFGSMDVLVANAGVAHVVPTIDQQAADWDRVIGVNLRGTMFTVQNAGRIMVRQGRGSIITISSQLGLTPASERAAYIASKSGMIGLTKSLAIEWASKGVRVNSVAPGTTRTPMTIYLQENQAAGDAFRKRIPMGEFGEPEDTAAACLYLASNAASYVTGHVLVVDGGYSVW